MGTHASRWPRLLISLYFNFFSCKEVAAPGLPHETLGLLFTAFLAVLLNGFDFVSFPRALGPSRASWERCKPRARPRPRASWSSGSPERAPLGCSPGAEPEPRSGAHFQQAGGD